MKTTTATWMAILTAIAMTTGCAARQAIIPVTPEVTRVRGADVESDGDEIVVVDSDDRDGFYAVFVVRQGPLGPRRSVWEGNRYVSYR